MNTKIIQLVLLLTILILLVIILLTDNRLKIEEEIESTKTYYDETIQKRINELTSNILQLNNMLNNANSKKKKR